MQRLNYLPASWRYQIIPFLVVLSVVLVDQLSKLWVTSSLLLGESRPEEGILRLTHVSNDGVVFGISMPQPLAIILPLLIVVIILFLYYRYAAFTRNSIRIGLALVVAGSIGNLIDRFRLGHVTDFIDLRLWGDTHWPTFNVADSAIVVGIALIILFLPRLDKLPWHD